MTETAELRVFGKYRVCAGPDGGPAALGRGAFGTTYRAQALGGGREVALKVIHDNLVADKKVRARFVQEAREHRKLNHPGIARILDHGEEGGHLFYVMEYCRGGNLGQFVAARGPLPVLEVLRVIRQVADALVYAHGYGLIHRDLKPDNLMLFEEVVPGDELQVKVIDFGLVKRVREQAGVVLSHMSQSGGFHGTLNYASPEQVREEPLDKGSDIFALGMTAWHLIHGGFPVAGADSGFKVIQDRTSDESYAARLPESLPACVRDVLARMIEKKRQHRYSECGELVVALDVAIEKLEHLGPETLIDGPPPHGVPAQPLPLGEFYSMAPAGNLDLGFLFDGADLKTGDQVELLILRPDLDKSLRTEICETVHRIKDFPHPAILRLSWMDARDGQTVVRHVPHCGTLLDSLRQEGQKKLDAVIPLLVSAASAFDHATRLGLRGLDASPRSVYRPERDTIIIPARLCGTRGGGAIDPAASGTLVRTLGATQQPDFSEPGSEQSALSQFATLAYWLLSAAPPPQMALVSPNSYRSIQGLLESSNNLLREALAELTTGPCEDLLQHILNIEGKAAEFPPHADLPDRKSVAATAATIILPPSVASTASRVRSSTPTGGSTIAPNYGSGYPGDYDEIIYEQVKKRKAVQEELDRERKAREDAERKYREEAERIRRDADRQTALAREHARKQAAEIAAKREEDLKAGREAAMREAEARVREQAEAQRAESERRSAEAAAELERQKADAEAKARAQAEAFEKERKERAELEASLRKEAQELRQKERQEREEAERAAREAERVAKEELAKERKAREEELAKERKAREEAERIASLNHDQAAKEQIERERRERAEAERIAREELAKERKAREEAERKAKEELAAEKCIAALAARKATEDAERKAKAELERERLAKLELERQKKASDEAARKAREEAERKVDIERKAREEVEKKAKADAETAVRKAREEAERKAGEEVERERKAKLELERQKKDAEELARKTKEEAEKATRAAKAEADRQLEKEREALEKERKARADAERRASQTGPPLWKRASAWAALFVILGGAGYGVYHFEKEHPDEPHNPPPIVGPAKNPHRVLPLPRPDLTFVSDLEGDTIDTSTVSVASSGKQLRLERIEESTALRLIADDSVGENAELIFTAPGFEQVTEVLTEKLTSVTMKRIPNTSLAAKLEDSCKDSKHIKDVALEFRDRGDPRKIKRTLHLQKNELLGAGAKPHRFFLSESEQLRARTTIEVISGGTPNELPLECDLGSSSTTPQYVLTLPPPLQPSYSLEANLEFPLMTIRPITEGGNKTVNDNFKYPLSRRLFLATSKRVGVIYNAFGENAVTLDVLYELSLRAYNGELQNARLLDTGEESLKLAWAALESLTLPKGDPGESQREHLAWYWNRDTRWKDAFLTAGAFKLPGSRTLLDQTLLAAREDNDRIKQPFMETLNSTSRLLGGKPVYEEESAKTIWTQYAKLTSVFAVERINADGRYVITNEDNESEQLKETYCVPPARIGAEYRVDWNPEKGLAEAAKKRRLDSPKGQIQGAGVNVPK